MKRGSGPAFAVTAQLGGFLLFSYCSRTIIQGKSQSVSSNAHGARPTVDMTTCSEIDIMSVNAEGRACTRMERRCESSTSPIAPAGVCAKKSKKSVRIGPPDHERSHKVLNIQGDS